MVQLDSCHQVTHLKLIAKNHYIPNCGASKLSLVIMSSSLLMHVEFCTASPLHRSGSVCSHHFIYFFRTFDTLHLETLCMLVLNNVHFIQLFICWCLLQIFTLHSLRNASVYRRPNAVVTGALFLGLFLFCMDRVQLTHRLRCIATKHFCILVFFGDPYSVA